MLFNSYSYEILHEQFHWIYLQGDIKLLLVTVNKGLNLKSKSFTTYRVTLYLQTLYDCCFGIILLVGNFSLVGFFTLVFCPLNAAHAISEHVHLSVCPSVTLVSHACLNGSRYWNMLCTVQYRDLSSFLRPNSHHVGCSALTQAPPPIWRAATARSRRLRGAVETVQQRLLRPSDSDIRCRAAYNSHISKTVPDRRQVTINHTPEVAYGLYTGAEIGDLEWPWTT